MNDHDEDVLDREQIAADLKDLGLESAETMSTFAMICERVVEPGEPSNIRESDWMRLGGVPDVPPGFEWPTHQGNPLSFLGQFDFDEDDVLLSLFYDCIDCPWGFSPNDRGSGRVFTFEKNNLAPAAIPSGLADEFQFESKTVVLSLDISMPGSRSLLIEAYSIPDCDVKIIESLEQDQEENGRPMHHFFGYPALVQNDMELECQLASNGIDCGNDVNLEDPRVMELEEGVDDWQLLFQCDSDSDTGWHWGDDGRLYFWIKTADFVAGNFDNVWVILQSH